MGIEPTSEAWEASILPLYDARSGVSDFLILQQSDEGLHVEAGSDAIRVAWELR